MNMTRAKWGSIRALKCRLGFHNWMPNNDPTARKALGSAYCLYCPTIRP